jgi:iron complex outermembrane receptor protein
MKLHLKFLFFFTSLTLFAQQKNDSIIQIQALDEVVLKATRLSEQSIRSPLAVSLIISSRNALLEPQLSINESLISVPGLFAQNAYNFNQDLRVSIRGFGARSAFGIRGVKLIVDGIPETTPDGQGQIDNLLVGLIDRIEVIRGPSASFYGNASGGVIYMSTLEEINEKVRLNYTTGSYGLHIAQALVSMSKNNNKALLALSHSRSDGYRDHSAFSQFQSNYKSVRTINKKNKLLWQVNYTHGPS